MSDFSVMNVYQMYIAGKDTPYYGNPEVRADIYTLNGVLHQANAIIPVPGTYKTWRQIESPKWWAE
jgi:hypothetical protein